MAAQKKAPIQVPSIFGTDVGAESGLMQHNKSDLDKIASKWYDNGSLKEKWQRYRNGLQKLCRISHKQIFQKKIGSDAECCADAGAEQFAEGCAVVLADACAEKFAPMQV